jgi:hypothetical protein
VCQYRKVHWPLCGLSAAFLGLSKGVENGRCGAAIAAIYYPALALDDRKNDWNSPYTILSTSKPGFDELIKSAIPGLEIG